VKKIGIGESGAVEEGGVVLERRKFNDLNVDGRELK
jgi:hypothetical protein